MSVQVGLGLSDILRAFRNGIFFKAHLLAGQIVTEKLSAVVGDVMLRATPYEETCPTCEGTGRVMSRPTKKNPEPFSVRCQICNGKGQVRHIPEVDRQRLALELGELIKPPKSGPTLLQQFNMGGNQPPNPSATAPGSLEQLQQAVSDLLYGNRRATGENNHGNGSSSDSELSENVPHSLSQQVVEGETTSD